MAAIVIVAEFVILLLGFIVIASSQREREDQCMHDARSNDS